MHTATKGWARKRSWEYWRRQCWMVSTGCMTLLLCNTSPPAGAATTASVLHVLACGAPPRHSMHPSPFPVYVTFSLTSFDSPSLFLTLSQHVCAWLACA